MKPSNNCYNLIKSFEGCKLNSYPDPGTHAAPYTIGYGTTVYPNGKKVLLGENISQEYAEECLECEVDKKAQKVASMLNGANLKQNQFDALVSFAYNCGEGNLLNSTLLKKVHSNPNDPSIRDEFMKWCRAGGQVMNGLKNRREKEADLYFG